MTTKDSTPLTMRHQRRGAKWAMARFEDGGFSLYRRDVNSVWRPMDRSRPVVRIYVGTIYQVA